MSDRPAHGIEGWALEDLDWDPDTGVARLEYSNKHEPPWVAYVAQPYLPTHEGWAGRPSDTSVVTFMLDPEASTRS